MGWLEQGFPFGSEDRAIFSTQAYGRDFNDRGYHDGELRGDFGASPWRNCGPILAIRTAPIREGIGAASDGGPRRLRGRVALMLSGSFASLRMTGFRRQRLFHDAFFFQNVPHLPGGDRHIDVLHAEVRERVDYRVHKSRRRAYVG